MKIDVTSEPNVRIYIILLKFRKSDAETNVQFKRYYEEKYIL